MTAPLGPELPFAKIWWYYWLALAVGPVALVVLAGLITKPGVLALLYARPLPADWEWSGVLFGDVGLIIFAIYVYWLFTQYFGTRLFEEGVRQPRFLRRPCFLRWSDITRVERHPLALRLSAGEQRLILNLVVFRDPAAVVAEVGRRQPPGVTLGA